jgi:hypothetical protein
MQGFVVGKLGTGTDEAHIATEDIPELGQLVELITAKQRAYRGNTGIAGDGDAGAVFVVAAGGHRAEFVEGKFPPVPTHASLPEEDRTRGAQTDEQSRESHERQKDDEGHDGEEAIENPARGGESPWTGVAHGAHLRDESRETLAPGGRKPGGVGGRNVVPGSVGALAGFRRKYVIKRERTHPTPLLHGVLKMCISEGN